METIVLKLLLILLMGLVPMAFGILPMKVLHYFMRRNGDSAGMRTLLSVFTCFAAGVILGVSFIELFPEAREGIAELAETEKFYASYPFVELFVGVGFLLVYFIEEFMTIFFGHHHHHTHNHDADDVCASKWKRGITNDAMSNDANSENGELTKRSLSPQYDKKNLVTVNSVEIHPANLPSNIQDYESMAPRSNAAANSTPLKVSAIESNVHALSIRTSAELGSPISQYSDSSSDNGGGGGDGMAFDIPKTHHQCHHNGAIIRIPSLASSSDEQCDIGAEDRRKAIIGAITLVTALFLHTSLEGFAFGIQKEVISVGSLFFGIIVHKILVFFSVGINLAQALPNNPRIVVSLIVLLASFSPIGAIVGIVVESLEMSGNIKGVVSTILICVSIGTFLYIALFEILAPERHKPVHRLLQWFGCAFGFALMCAVLSLAQHDHGRDGSHHSHSHDESM